MPLTPYHFGPGTLIKSLAPRHFSLSAFVATNVAIDVETLTYLIARQYPVHRFFHSFLGASIVGLAVSVSVILVARWVGSSRFATRIGELPAWVRQDFATTGALVGGLVGGTSHTLLDGLMHRDLRPFAPISESNPLLGLVAVDSLLMLCLVAGTVGIAIVALRSLRTSDSSR